MTPARKTATKQGVNRAAAARFFNVDPQTINDWEAKHWLVRYPDRSINLDATAARVAEMRNPFVGGKPDRGPDPKQVRTPAQIAGVDGQAGTGAGADDAFDNNETAADADVTYSEAHRRAELAKALKLELEVARMRGDLIPRDAAETVFCDVMAKLKANIEAIPNQVAPLLIGQTELVAIRRVLEAGIEKALSAVSAEPPEVTD